MKIFKSKKAIVLLGAMVVAVAASLGAYAYFTNTGTTTGTPVVVGDQSPAFAVALNSQLNPGLNPLATLYAEPNCTTPCVPAAVSALLPAPIGDQNAVVATVPFTVTNGSEGSELLTSYTITLSGTNGVTGPPCTSADFAVNGVAYTAPVTVSSGGSPALPHELSPLTDAPANSYASTFTLQLLDPNHNQDNCQNWHPIVTVDATS